MVKHGTWCDVAESESGIFQSIEKRRIHSSEDLRRERSTEIVVESDVCDCLRIDTEGNGNCCGGTNGRWGRARMYRNGDRNTCTGKVVGVTLDHGEVAMQATATH